MPASFCVVAREGPIKPLQAAWLLGIEVTFVSGTSTCRSAIDLPSPLAGAVFLELGAVVCLGGYRVSSISCTYPSNRP